MKRDDVENAISKGCLISERFSFWLKSPQEKCQITTLSTIQQKAPLFGDLSQCENLSEISHL